MSSLIINDYVEWLEDRNWKYLVTLHFKSGFKPSVDVVTRLVNQLTNRLNAVINGKRSCLKLSVFPTLESSIGGIPHVHLLLGPENEREMNTGGIARAISDIWGKQEKCVNPLLLGKKNSGWFKTIDENKCHVISYVCKEFRLGNDPVLIESIKLNNTK
jgi:hypothetical protein